MFLIAETLLTVGIAVVVGVPLGIIAGRLTGTDFAQNIGVLARLEIVPLLVLAVIVAVAWCFSVLIASVPLALSLCRRPRALANDEILAVLVALADQRVRR